jgi:lantibiotic leader peptide-processing serine protease
MKRTVQLFPTIALGLAVLACTEGPVPTDAGLLAASKASTSTGSTYVVLYKGNGVPADAAQTIAKAGGTLAYSYDEIGVAIANSTSSAFAQTLAKNSKIDGVSATAGFATRLAEEILAAGPLPDATPAPGDDLFSQQQWDMVQIHAPEARAINGGSPSVVVGDIDTGIDYTHPDLVANIDFSKSVSCISGVPNSNPAAWNDDNGHGTHTAGTIAAAKNGIGIVGVAPNVKIAAIKAGNADGYFFPEAVICSFVWAGSQHLDVTNNSYFADPWQFNCHNDPEQQAIWKAEQRAIRYAMQQGVTVVALPSLSKV